jgi:hypothetical protein
MRKGDPDSTAIQAELVKEIKKPQDNVTRTRSRNIQKT